jgi:hypothetical protein
MIRILIFICITYSMAWSQKIDSLIQLAGQRPDDHLKANLLNDISRAYRRQANDNLAIVYGLKAKDLAIALNDKVVEYEALDNISGAYDHMGMFEDALATNELAWKRAKELDSLELVIRSMKHQAFIYYSMYYESKAAAVSLEVYAMAKKSRNPGIIAEALTALADVYETINLDSSIKYNSLAADIYEKLGQRNVKALVLANIASNYSDKNEFKYSMSFYQQALRILNERKEFQNKAFMLAMIGKQFAALGQTDSAIFYFDEAMKWHKQFPAITTYAFALLSRSEILIAAQNADTGSSLDNHLINLDLNEAIEIFNTYKNYKFLFRAYAALEKLALQHGNYKKAYEYSKLLFITKDSLDNRQQKMSINELTAKYDLEEKELRVKQLQKNNATNNFVISLLISIVLLIIFIAILLISRQRLHYENDRRELTMVALRAQMNPHFIFNCLNSISNFVTRSQIREATEYLSKFAKLIRLILDNSKHHLVSLEQEINTLKLYLELEAMRFNNKFTFRIHLDEELDVESVRIAPMIIQPFVENAIWHGLQPKGQNGKLDIEFKKENRFIRCTITDNGVGRKKMPDDRGMVEKTKSYGIQLTKDRLELLSKKDFKASVNIIDLIEQGHPVGTKVELIMAL